MLDEVSRSGDWCRLFSVLMGGLMCFKLQCRTGSPSHQGLFVGDNCRLLGRGSLGGGNLQSTSLLWRRSWADLSARDILKHLVR